MSDPSDVQPTDNGDQSNQWAAPNNAAEKIAGHMAMLRRCAKVSRLQLWIIIVVLLAEIIIFGVLTYSKVRKDFSMEKVIAEADRRGSLMLPMVLKEAEHLWDSTSPVYRDLMMDRFDTITPEIMDEFVVRARRFPENIRGDIQQMLEKSLRRIGVRAESEIRQTYPSLVKPEEQQRLVARFEEKIYDESAPELRKYVNELFKLELSRVKGIVKRLRFDTPAHLDNKSEEDLQLLLLHHLVMLLDDTIMSEEKLPTEIDVEEPKLMLPGILPK